MQSVYNSIYIVEVNGCEINKVDIVKCVEVFKGIKKDRAEKPQLHIIANNKVLEFDFSLIGHLVLFKSEIPRLSIKIQLKYNSLIEDNSDKRDKSVLWKLKQAMVHAYYSCKKSVFEVQDKDGNISSVR